MFVAGMVVDNSLIGVADECTSELVSTVWSTVRVVVAVNDKNRNIKFNISAVTNLVKKQLFCLGKLGKNIADIKRIKITIQFARHWHETIDIVASLIFFHKSWKIILNWRIHFPIAYTNVADSLPQCSSSVLVFSVFLVWYVQQRLVMIVLLVLLKIFSLNHEWIETLVF